MSAVEEQIRDFVLSELLWDGAPDALTNDLPLVDRVLDSLGIVQLTAFLEHRFGIRVRDEEVLPRNFESIAAIAGFVASKQR
jgi:acyl carrier protein